MLWIKQLFCNHDFEFIQQIKRFECSTDTMPYKIERVYICKKCTFKNTIKI